MKNNLINLLLSLLCVSCNTISICKNKEIKAHYQIVDRIINNPDSNFYAIIDDTNYVNARDYYFNFSFKELQLKYIKDNFQNGYTLEHDKLYDQPLNDSTVCKMHDIVIRSKSTKKILCFAFWKRYNNQWSLLDILYFYGPAPEPDDAY